MLMNWKFWQEKVSIYDEPIAAVLSEMNTYGPDSPEYPTLLANLERLSSMKNSNKNIMRISPDTLAIVGGNLLGILIIVAYEQTHPMTSKSLNFIKPKSP